jgi:hypothetical protein
LRLVPGEILAEVQGSRRTPYKVRVRVRPFTDTEWNRVLDALVTEIGHTAALLDGELPTGVAEDIRSIGLDLLPGAGEVQPRCSCPDWADPCKHAAAVCYLVADLLDDDAFGVLLLRGRERDEILSSLRSRRHPVSSPLQALLDVEAETDKGVPAREAWSRVIDPLPDMPSLQRRPGRPTVLATDPPAGSNFDTSALRALATDAAARAFILAQGTGLSGLELTTEQDLARRAALLLSRDEVRGSIGLAELARHIGMPVRELLRRAIAFRDGGPEGLAVLDGTWDSGPGAVEAGRALLGPGAVTRHNRVTLAEHQLRLGRDGRYYPFRKDRSGRWQPDGTPISEISRESDLGDLIDDTANG